MKKVISSFIVCFFILLLSACGSSCNIQNLKKQQIGPTKLGVLANNIYLYADKSDVAINPTKTDNVKLFLVGSPILENYNINFNSIDGVGINPTNCLLNARNNSCTLTFSASKLSKAGIYRLIPVVTSASMKSARSMRPIRVSVSVPTLANTKDILSFIVYDPADEQHMSHIGIINGTNISITIPYNTNIANLVANFAINGVNITVNNVNQNSGSVYDFTNSIKYIVIAQDNSTKEYIVKVTKEASPKSSANNLLTFSFIDDKTNTPAVAYVDQTKKTVTMYVTTNDVDLSKLVANFTISDKAQATIIDSQGVAQPQSSGTTINDFTNPVVYTVTAEDGVSSQQYTVSLIKTSFFYIANYGDNQQGDGSIVGCNASMARYTDDTLTNCTTYAIKSSSDISFKPMHITINNTQNNIYITNLTGPSIYACSINSINGSIVNCTINKDISITSPKSIVVDSNESNAYINNQDTNKVIRCAINNKMLTSCISNNDTNNTGFLALSNDNKYLFASGNQLNNNFISTYTTSQFSDSPLTSTNNYPSLGDIMSDNISFNNTLYINSSISEGNTLACNTDPNGGSINSCISIKKYAATETPLGLAIAMASDGFLMSNFYISLYENGIYKCHNGDSSVFLNDCKIMIVSSQFLDRPYGIAVKS